MSEIEEGKISNTKKGGVPERVWQSVRIFEMLSEAEVGTTLTYQELGEAIRVKDIRERPWILNSARKRALRELGYVFATDYNVGVRRVDGEGKVILNEKTLKGVAKTARRVKAVSKSVSTEEWLSMSVDQRITSMTQAATASAIIDAAKPKKQKSLPLGGTPPQLPPWAKEE